MCRLLKFPGKDFEAALPFFPVGEPAGHERAEARAVGPFEEVVQLVHHHGFDARHGFRRQFQREGQLAGGGAAAPPPALRAADDESRRRNAHAGRPFGDEIRDHRGEFPFPAGGKEGGPVGAGAPHGHDRRVAVDDASVRRAAADAEHHPPPEEAVRFPVFPGKGRRGGKTRERPLDPVPAAVHEGAPHRLGRARRDGDAHRAVPSDADVHVPHGFVRDPEVHPVRLRHERYCGASSAAARRMSSSDASYRPCTASFPPPRPRRASFSAFPRSRTSQRPLMRT